MLDGYLTTTKHGWLPHTIIYSQIDPDKYPGIAQQLRRLRYFPVKYNWLHIPSRKSGESIVWVITDKHAHLLVEFWNRSGGTEWKYWLAE